MLQGKRVYSLACSLAFCVLFIAGCVTFYSSIPGYQQDKDGLHSVYPPKSGNEVLYSVLTWYKGAGKGALPALVLAERERAGEQLFVAWAEGLCQRYGAFLEMKNGMPVVKKTVNPTEDSALVQSLRNASKELEAPLGIEIPEADFWQIWFHVPESYREQYLLWRKKNVTLPMPLPVGFNQRELRKAIDSLCQRVVHYGQVKDALNLAEKAVSLKEMTIALEKGCAVISSLPKDIDFHQLGDTVSLQKIQQLQQTLPIKIVQMYVSEVQTELDNDKARLQRVKVSFDPLLLMMLERREAEFSLLLDKWRKDPCYANAVKLKELTACIQALGTVRKDYWCALLESKKIAYWEVCLAYCDIQKTLQQKHSKEMKLYKGAVMEQLRGDVRNVYLKKLEEACKEFVPRAERYRSIGNQAGASYACCLTLEELFVPVKGALNEELKKYQDRIQQLQLQMQRVLAQDKQVRTFKIKKLGAALEGIDLVYSMDLQNELKLTLRYLGLEPYVRVIPLEDESSRLLYTYVLEGGMVAEYRADEQTVGEKNRVAYWVRAAQKRLNPDYQLEAGPKAALRHRVEYIYEQEEIEQTVHIKDIQRQAQIRISSLNLKGPAMPQDVQEFSEIYRRNFITENSDPLKNVREKRYVYYSEKETKQTVEARELRVDRVWSEGEMLDWARRDSLKMVALLLAYYVDRYPLYLYQQGKSAENSGKRDVAAEYLGQCHCLCQTLSFEQNIKWPELLSKQAEDMKKLYATQRAESQAMKAQLKLQIIQLIMAR